MVATSLLELEIREVLARVEKLTDVKLPRSIIEISLEPELKMLCIRFKKPKKAEFGEPLCPGVHVFSDKDTKEITAIEITDLDRLYANLSNNTK
ncbi:MAG: hypothetical protein QW270_08710 [Candidatus Bathyarchaeia archaeon]